MSKSAAGLPETLGALRNYKGLSAKLPHRSVKDELRENLICRLQKHEPLFPGIVGFDDTVVPQVVNAVLSRHNFILLGLRGQAKTQAGPYAGDAFSTRAFRTFAAVRFARTILSRRSVKPAATSCAIWAMRRRSPGFREKNAM